LNAYLNVWNLNQILCIQGLSDWSVERIMEQNLTKGNVVVLHLEESPQSTELQNLFLDCLMKMLQRKLWFRYPEYRSNVVFLWTSNYLPSEEIRRTFPLFEYCLLTPPTKEMQRKWLIRKLTCAMTIKGPEVIEIDELAFPKETKDIRPLNAWWLSISHALRKIAIGDQSLTPFIRHVTSATNITIGWKKDNQVVKEATLRTIDGYFYYDPSAVSSSVIDPKTKTILEMAIGGSLTPAVIVLKGSKSWQNELQRRLHRELSSMIRSDEINLASTEVELFDQSDEEKVMGESGEIRGGLFRFIDDATNPNSTNKRIRRVANNQSLIDLCLVMARVNEIGTMFLRELLENGDKSRTHRLGIIKKGLIFVISLAEGADMTPQLESRAHQIVVEHDK